MKKTNRPRQRIPKNAPTPEDLAMVTERRQLGRARQTAAGLPRELQDKILLARREIGNRYINATPKQRAKMHTLANRIIFEQARHIEKLRKKEKSANLKGL